MYKLCPPLHRETDADAARLSLPPPSAVELVSIITSKKEEKKSLPPVCFFSFFAVSRLLPPSNLHRFQGPRARLRVYSPVSTHGPRHHCETLAKENPKMLFPLRLYPSISGEGLEEEEEEAE